MERHKEQCAFCIPYASFVSYLGTVIREVGYLLAQHVAVIQCQPLPLLRYGLHCLRDYCFDVKMSVQTSSIA